MNRDEVLDRNGFGWFIFLGYTITLIITWELVNDREINL